MSLPVDAITNKRLVLVKQLYQQGIQSSSAYGPARRILAVVEFDLASETAMKTVVSSLTRIHRRTPMDGVRKAEGG